MIEIKSTIDEQRSAGRYVVVLGNKFSIEDRTITLDRKELKESIDAMVAWANVPPRKTGRFYLDGSLKDIEKLGIELDDRFCLCSSQVKESPKIEEIVPEVKVVSEAVEDTSPIIESEPKVEPQQKKKRNKWAYGS